jgi:hypothetical protein
MAHNTCKQRYNKNDKYSEYSMEKIKAKPMEIKTFMLVWMLSVYLLWPALIIPVTLAIYLLPPYYTYKDFAYIYWVGADNKAIFVAIFTLAMGFVQAWMFRRFLFIHIKHWTLMTIVGGLTGTLLMWLLRWNTPFEMFTWFLGISLAQFWLLRSRAKNAWLWILAHLCLSLFFPIYADDWLLVVAKWLIATSVYAAGTLFVLRELGKDALS